LKEQGIELHDDFKLLRNESQTGIGEYFHVFELEISRKDKQRIIDQFTHAPGYKGFVASDMQWISTANRYEGEEVIEYSEDEFGFVRESCKPMGKDYAPLHRIVTISKKENQLTLQEIDD
jgi:uncharacterized protein (UPF0248 family)